MIGTSLWVWDNRRAWQSPSTLAAFIRQVQAIPGPRRVLLKGADGQYTGGPYGPWDRAINDQFRAAGIQVGLWVFQYGSGKTGYGERPGVAAELAALERALAVDHQLDCLILNIEEQVMTSPRPEQAVAELVRGAKRLAGVIPVGLSSVWRWANWDRPWPFAAARDAGLDFWSNQIYSEGWGGSVDYVGEAYRIHHAIAPAIPDYPSLWSADPATGASMTRYASQAIRLGAPGIAWWKAENLTPERWAAVAQVGTMLQELALLSDPVDVALERAWQQQVARYGEKLYALQVDKPWYRGKALRCRRGTLGVVAGTLIVDLTGYLLDDAESMQAPADQAAPPAIGAITVLR